MGKKLYTKRSVIPLQDGGSRVYTCTGEFSPWFSTSISDFAEQGLEAEAVRHLPDSCVSVHNAEVMFVSMEI